MNNIYNILIVDDDESDITLIEEMVSLLKINCHIETCHDGDEVIPKLEQHDNIDLILLDLNMPRKNGFEVLHELKSKEKYKYIPVIVLSTSDSDNDVEKSYKLMANCYIRKPFELKGYEKLLRSINNFWIETVSKPNE